MRRGWWIGTTSLALLLATLVVLARTYVFNSDDVGLQTVLHTWRPGSGDVRVGEDTFLLKAPLYLVANAVGTSKTVLTVTSLVLNGIGWLLLLLGGRSLLRRWGTTASGGPAALWLAGMGGVLGALLLRPNIRNIELGMAAALLAALAVLDDRWPDLSPRARAARAGGLAVLLGALILDDPYVGYVVFLPAAVVLAAYSLVDPSRRTRWWLVPGVVGAALVLWQVGVGSLESLGFHPTGEGRELPAANQLGSAVVASLEAVQVVANGAADAGNGWLDVRAAANLVSLGVVLAIGSWALLRKARRDPWALVVLGLPFAVVGAHVLSGHSLRDGTERYVVLVVVVAALFAAVAGAALSRRGRVALVAVLAASLGLNVVATASRLREEPARSNISDEVSPALIAAGLDRGYADFWYANTITYTSAFAVDALPVFCHEGRIEKRLNYVDAARFEEQRGPSFILHDPKVAPCSLAEMETQFGPPDRMLRLSLGRLVLVYGYDLTQRI